MEKQKISQGPGVSLHTAGGYIYHRETMTEKEYKKTFLKFLETAEIMELWAAKPGLPKNLSDNVHLMNWAQGEVDKKIISWPDTDPDPNVKIAKQGIFKRNTARKYLLKKLANETDFEKMEHIIQQIHNLKGYKKAI